MTLIFAIPLWIILPIVNLAVSQAKFSVSRWNKRLMEFEPVPGVPSYEMERKLLALRRRNEETHNFNEQPLRISYYEDPGFFHFYDNDTKIAGVCGDMWNILSEITNFTIVLKKWEQGSLGFKLPNGTFNGILEDARLNKTDVIPKLQIFRSRTGAVDFTPPFWSNGERVFALAQWKRDHAWMFKLFTIDVWLLIAVFIMILSLASILTQKAMTSRGIHSPHFHSCSFHFFNTFATLCNQAHMIDSIKGAWRILMLTVVTFSWLVLISYSSCLIYSVARETIGAPFSDLETLFTYTKIGVVILNGSLGHSTFLKNHTMAIFKHLLRAGRVTIVSNLTDLHDKICLSSGQYALYSGIDAVLGMGITDCRLLPVGSTYYLSTAASGISKNVKYKKTLDIGFMKLREFGLIDALRKRYVPNTKIDDGIRRTASLAIDIDHILMVLSLYFLGVAASVVLCVAENVLVVLKKRRSVKKALRRVPVVM